MGMIANYQQTTDLELESLKASTDLVDAVDSDGGKGCGGFGIYILIVN